MLIFLKFSTKTNFFSNNIFVIISKKKKYSLRIVHIVPIKKSTFLSSLCFAQNTPLLHYPTLRRIIVEIYMLMRGRFFNENNQMI